MNERGSAILSGTVAGRKTRPSSLSLSIRVRHIQVAEEVRDIPRESEVKWTRGQFDVRSFHHIPPCPI